MKNIDKIYKAAELMEEFCAEVGCLDCPLKKLCNKMDKDKPIGQKIIESIGEVGV